MKYAFHPICELFPQLAGAEFRGLVEDIRTHGLREAIWLYQGQIIDGKNRYRACEELGLKPRFREWSGEGSLTAFVLSQNVHRRHLSASQRACIGLELLPFYEQEAKERQLATLKKGQQKPVSAQMRERKAKASEKAAEMVKVSPRYVEHAKRIKAERPEDFEAIKRGDKTISEVMHELGQFEIPGLPNGVKLTPVGMEIKPDLTFDDWLRVGKMLKAFESVVESWGGTFRGTTARRTAGNRARQRPDVKEVR